MAEDASKRVGIGQGPDGNRVCMSSFTGKSDRQERAVNVWAYLPFSSRVTEILLRQPMNTLSVSPLAGSLSSLVQPACGQTNAPSITGSGLLLAEMLS